MSFEYKGMRWLKCDLQVQTPEDSRHWADQDLRLLEPRRPMVDSKPDERDIQEKARIFLTRCYELNLDVIGLTDHNFSNKTDPRDWFAVHLIEQNKAVAARFNRPPIVFLPGFEVDIGYHLLCLFAPAKKQRDLIRCNRILTKLGLTEGARFDAAGPKQLRHNNARVSLKELIEIVQEEHDGIVIAAHSDQARGLFYDTSNRDDYGNQKLYCVELTQNPPALTHQDILSGKNTHWCRKHSHPAWIMSSDAKSIKHDDSVPRPNSLGYRYTWIKMSSPSIESLRQAFLDHESRIFCPIEISTDVNPDHKNRQAFIESISIKNMPFLGDQEIVFSRNLNCIIGGRGSGKSTLLEYLRIMLGKEGATNVDDETKKRIARVRNTMLSTEAKIEVRWSNADGIKDCLIWQNNGTIVAGREIVDPETFFNSIPVSIYSQQQLNKLTDTSSDTDNQPQASRLSSLLDGFVKEELATLSHHERALKLKLADSFNEKRRADNLTPEISKLSQEILDLERLWLAKDEISAITTRHQALKAESKYLETILGAKSQTFAEVVLLAKNVENTHVDFTVEDAPHDDWFKKFDANVRNLKKALAEKIEKDVNDFYAAVEAIKRDDSLFPSIEFEINNAENEFQMACIEKSLSDDDIDRLQEVGNLRLTKTEELDALRAERAAHLLEAGNTQSLINDLHAIWRLQYEKRSAAAEYANEVARLGEGRDRFIEVSVSYQSDLDKFYKLWGSFSNNDSRTKLGKGWDNLGKVLYKLFIENCKEFDSPWQLLEASLCDRTETAGKDFGELTKELYSHVKSNTERWEKLLCSRVDDTVDLKLFRADGSLAGSIAQGTLSDGQRNTAALALLLSQSGGPLLVDQPEDELDSNFVFKELIPMLRKVKANRQLILTTHNANLPVNGDAELIYALEVKNGRGEVLAQGGLDQMKVTTAVLDIMEGTEEAFRRRREKYHF